MNNSGENGLALLAAILALFVILAIVVSVWFLVACVIAIIRYWQWRKRAEADFDLTAREAGLNYDPDDVIHTAFGAGIHLSSDGYQNVGEWATGTLFGVEERESA